MPKRLIAIFAPLLCLLAVGVLCWVLGEVFWFREVGYLAVYGLRLLAKVAIGAIVTITSAAFLLVNLVLASQWQSSKKAFDSPEKAYRRPDRYPTGFSPPSLTVVPSPAALPLHWLLPLVVCLSLLLLLLLLHFGQAGGQILWGYLNQQTTVFPLPNRFKPGTILHLVRSFLLPPAAFPYVGLGLFFGGAIALLLYPKRFLTVVACVLSLVWGITLSAHWDKILQYFNPTPFTRADPVFGRDISFYIFALPFWELLEFWLVGLFGVGLLSVALVYLLGGESLSQGSFQGFSQWQKQHLYGLGTGVMLGVALGYWLSRYELLYSSRGAVYGASYTDVSVSLPINTLLSFLALLVAAFLLWEAMAGMDKRSGARWLPRSLPLPLLVGSILIAAIAGFLLPTVVQRFVVQPNELAREQPYLRRTIALTREAFDLNNIEVKTFQPQDTLTAADLQKNDLTVRNIRLWDTRPLLQTNRQLQQIRPYYKFFNADIDRYAISNPQPGGQQSINQQVLISARELDYNDVPKAAQTWINEHLVYTHGYGFTLSPVNQVAAGGLPYYFVKDIGVGEGDATSGNLTITSKQVRSSIPISSPRIYYGEITNTYVMTNTRMQELDYPSGNDNAYNVYDGRGGVSIGQTWQRWLYAVYLKDWQMLFTRNFTPQSRLLFRRNINQRIRAIAPFLTYDHDPYMVVASAPSLEQQGNDGRNPTRNYLYWMVDAYTVSDRYPYADATRIASESGESPPLNYIRNSVKVVIDAYNGSVHFYIANPNDPIIQTWARIFPGLFQPLSAMPESLQSHIRFPIDLFTVQSERLLTYHMTDPQVFYNREDQWQVPTEIYGSEPRLVEPYYLITKLSTGTREEFVLLLPFTPRQRTNLTAWLAARSDGKNYGKALLYTFPKQELVYGTEQIEARINQDPVISQQISLWNRQGSRAIQGNLLVIPIKQSLLYVEPLYLEATQNSLPTLVRVIVAYANQIAMAESLEQSLRAIFTPEKPATPAIVRPVQ
jgi:uncharacterized membrane protein (UPF0182 family)